MAAVPATAILVLFGRQFLLIYGTDFTRGAMALCILSIGYLVGAVFGPASLLLISIDHEKLAATGAGAGLAVKLGLNILLIPAYGLEGATTAIGNVVSSILLVACVRRKLGVWATVLGRVGF